MNGDSKLSPWTAEQVKTLENEAGNIGSMLKAQASLLFGQHEKSLHTLSEADLHGIGSMLEEFGNRLHKAAGWT